MANTVVKEVAIKQILPDIKNFLNASSAFVEGDLVIYDASTYLVRAATAESELSALLGIAAVSVVNGKPPSPYSTDVDASLAIPAQNGPIYGCTAKFTLKTGDALNPGAALYAYPAGGNQAVSASGTKQIGVYQGPAISSAAAGTVVEALVGARFPNDTLKF